MRLLVGGGTGFIGQHLRRLVESKGHEMINLTRKSQTPKDITWAELEKMGLPKGIGSVVNLSGVNIMTPARWTEKLKQQVIASRVETTKTLVETIKAAEDKPKSFIAASAIGFYGSEDSGVEVTENSSAGKNFAAKLCEDWENAAALDGTDVRKVIVRIGLALGRDGGMVSSMYWPFFFGVGGNISDGKQWYPWIHVDDVAGIILHAIERTDVTGVLNAVSPQAVTNSEFTTVFSRSMCRPALFPIPKVVISTLLGEERADMMTSIPKILPTSTIDSGYEYIYPDLKSACNDCVKWG